MSGKRSGRRFGFAAVIVVVMSLLILLLALGVGAVLILGTELGAQRPFPARPLLFILAAGLATGTGLSLLVVRAILRPVAKLSEATKQVASGDFTVRLEAGGKLREIAGLYENFDKMLRELEGIETLRGDFVDNISHEFKTPLAAIEGYAMLLCDRAQSEAERREYAIAIVQSAQQLSELVSNILDLSRLENQRILVNRREFSLDEQIRQALVTLEPLWSRKNLELELELSEVRWTGSEELMAQVWLNLLGNAIKFSPEGGAIGVRLTEAPGEARVAIWDRGPGMSEEVRRHIFEKFYQADRTRGVEGNGLGLTLVRRILDLSGGAVAVESAPGKGSAFTVSLPKG